MKNITKILVLALVMCQMTFSSQLCAQNAMDAQSKAKYAKISKVLFFVSFLSEVLSDEAIKPNAKQ